MMVLLDILLLPSILIFSIISEDAFKLNTNKKNNTFKKYLRKFIIVYTLNLFILIRTYLFNFSILSIFLGLIILYLLNSLKFKKLINFFEMSVNLIFLFRKFLTNSSLAATIIVSNRELLLFCFKRIFTMGNFL